MEKRDSHYISFGRYVNVEGGEQVYAIATIPKKLPRHFLIMSSRECPKMRRPNWVNLGGARKQLPEAFLTFKANTKNLVVEA